MCITFRQEKEGLLNEAVKSLTEALGLDHNQQTAKENLERLQQQLKRNEQVGYLLTITLKNNLNEVYNSFAWQIIPCEQSLFDLQEDRRDSARRVDR